MIRQILIPIIIAVIFAGCNSQKQNTGTIGKTPGAADFGKLETRLGTAANTFSKDSVLLSFTVVNTTDTLQRFCKWETPFESILGKYFEVTDNQGNEALFKGAMARRVMPPPPESYIEVQPHDSVRTMFNLARNYSLKNEQYSVRYTGGGVSGLEPGNEIKISVNNP